MTDKSEIKLKLKMNESGVPGGSNSSTVAMSEPGNDLSKVGGNSNMNGGSNTITVGKVTSDDNGADVGPDMMMSPTGVVVNNGGHQHHHHHHHHHSHIHQQQQPQSVVMSNGSGAFYDQKSDISSTVPTEEDDGLGPLPPKWEKAYTDSGEVYFIDHNSGTSHWLDPRLSKFQKKTLEDCQDDELPYGWEKICDPHYGTYYIDHVNRKTQYENPVLQAKRMSERGNVGMSMGPGSSGMNNYGSQNGSTGHDETGTGIGRPNHFTKNPGNLRGERFMTTLVKSTRGLGFTIVGGDDNVEEFLQIKSIVPNGPAWIDGKLKTGDVLVYVNEICVLGFTHHEMVNIFQSILPGEEVHLDVCRGYPLPFDPNDPNTEVVTTIAVDGLNNGAMSESDLKFLETGGFMDPGDVQHKNPLAKIQSGGATANGGDVYFSDTHPYQQHYKSKEGNFEIPEILHINIVKSDTGFGFTITDSSYGQKVKKILDRQCCKNLQEGDILLSINSIPVKDVTHNEVVQVLKDCPKNIETTLKVQRGPSALLVGSSKMTNKLRKSIELAKFGGGLLKKEGYGIGGNSLFRSKTPTADLYSTQAKEILPTRPKTPLVDTRARAKTPSLPLSDLNTEEIELDVNKNTGDSKIDINLNLKSNSSSHDNDSIANDIGSFNNDDQYRLVKHSNLADRLGELTISSSNNSTTDNIYHNHQPQYGPGGHLQHQSNFNQNYNQLYSPPLVPPPPVPPISTNNHGYGHNPLLQPTYHHESCFCYDCQDYQRQQQQLHQQQQNMYQQQTINRSYMNNSSHMQPQLPYQLPPQMSDNIGKRLNEYLLDRKRSLHQQPPQHAQYDNLYHHHKAPVPLPPQHQHQQAPVPFDQHFYPSPANSWHGPSGGSGGGSQHSPQLYGGGAMYPAPVPMDDYTLTEVVLERQALGFGFRIVGGTEEGSQVTVGHIVPGGAADKDTRIASGDEILNINGVNVENASHHRVVQLMGEAGLRGQVTMILRRRKPSKPPPPPPNPRNPCNVLVSRSENEGFGFVIISSSGQYHGSSIGDLIPGSPAERCGELKIGDRIVAVNSIDISGMNHSDVVNLIKESGLQVQLTISCPRPDGAGSGLMQTTTGLTSAAVAASNASNTSGNEMYVSSSNGSSGPLMNRYPTIMS
ncbi:membrane-associated guanylate kinase, WW and PDZ domain-containing protein 1 [Malaya genurostris]|uniref:membrane-associated guanylate kinase, WW and PDZ domain-containing protein 1 n=1 Tax=Malaya genurostris TaxID=325434 RepID=UPI0026F3FBF0|nr:membrane-associated guanylate kinase, WW and PDZ domain-containing protein 1 [Malaya genurostris]XP_058458464.1 membrane-associated guanylate kinase, WW and PDZ domain-containing protein 1 [Malaya genurostris]XP_058458465.1 membrane-associated guanylate kinase, WW and PDZ domain-containing protein 1 [Malaya genurostris]XP_058458466.1 membrane-associated guanylate kinase, WW and PDZ domain-containing protein 1 [Malaya genurostris]XP_058458467.1 membrane-associated guanylate kinase, WW and PDZ